MKRIGPAILFLHLFAAVVFAEAGDTIWTIRTYADAYVAVSSELSNQFDRIEELDAALETARIRKDSALSIESKQLELEVAKLEIREIENAVATKAIELYIAWISSSRELEAALESHEIATAEYAIVENRYRAEEESERDLLSQRISLLQSRKALAVSRDRESGARNSLIRPLGLEGSAEFSPEIPMVIVPEEIIELDPSSVRASSSSYYRAFRTVRLKEKELEAKSLSLVFTESELQTLENALDDAKETLAAANWNLEDRIADIRLDLASIAADIEITALNLRLNETDLETAELQFGFGELLRTDRDKAKSKVRTSRTSLAVLNETLLKTLLSAADLGGTSVRSRLAELLSDEG